MLELGWRSGGRRHGEKTERRRRGEGKRVERRWREDENDAMRKREQIPTGIFILYLINRFNSRDTSPNTNHQVLENGYYLVKFQRRSRRIN